MEEYPVIQGHRLSWNAYAPRANRSIALQFPLTKRVAASLTSPKASPIKPRANVASGSRLHDCGAARYREIDPQSTIMAASSLQDFDALDEKSLTIRSAVSPSARIRSAARAYPIDLVASEAPTQKKRESIDIAISRRRTGGKLDEQASGCVILASHHRRHDSAAGPAYTGSDRPREGEPGYATSGTASYGFLHGGTASDSDYQRNYCDNLHRSAASLIEPGHDKARFRNGSDPYASGANSLLLTHTARGAERESHGNDECKRFHQHFPRGQSIAGNF